MTSHFKSLGIDRLSLAEQIALAKDILDHIGASHSAAQSPDGEAETVASAVEHQPSAEDLSAWEAVKAKALAQLGR